MEYLRPYLPMIIGMLFFVGYALYLRAPKRKKVKAVIQNVVTPPEDHIRFLIEKYLYDRDLAEQMWMSIKESTGFEDYYTTRIFAHKRYVEWYLKLTPMQQQKYDWDNRNSDLTVEVMKIPEYWNHRDELLQFIFRVRS